MQLDVVIKNTRWQSLQLVISQPPAKINSKCYKQNCLREQSSVNFYAQKCFSFALRKKFTPCLPQLSHVTENNPGSSLYRKCFLVNTLIGSFHVCFDLSDQNHERLL